MTKAPFGLPASRSPALSLWGPSKTRIHPLAMADATPTGALPSELAVRDLESDETMG